MTDVWAQMIFDGLTVQGTKHICITVSDRVGVSDSAMETKVPFEDRRGSAWGKVDAIRNHLTSLASDFRMYASSGTEHPFLEGMSSGGFLYLAQILEDIVALNRCPDGGAKYWGPLST